MNFNDRNLVKFNRKFRYIWYNIVGNIVIMKFIV